MMPQEMRRGQDIRWELRRFRFLDFSEMRSSISVGTQPILVGGNAQSRPSRSYKRKRGRRSYVDFRESFACLVDGT